MPYFRECPHCGDRLDPGEICDCRKAPRKETPPEPRLRPMRPYDRVRAQVYATGNRWAKENFHATHD